MDDDTVQKITGQADRPQQKIREFKNERLPSVAVTVDLLTTGVDVPKIVNLVFLRRVRSRILYEQMLGWATRLCPDLYGPGEDKEFFRIFDAVELYQALEDHTAMTPVVSDPLFTFGRLVDELLNVTHPEVRNQIKDQIQAKLQSKHTKIEKTLSEAFEAAVVAKLELIDQLDQSILAKAFRGELVPQDPNDESASVLLERIRADRETQSAKPRPKKKTPGSTKRTKKALPVSVNENDDLPLFNNLQK